MEEKKIIERDTAEGFLQIYNPRFGYNYIIKELSEIPDVICVDDKGQELNLEITMTEDRPGDIKISLGRAEGVSIDANGNVHGKMGPASCLTRNVTDSIVKRLHAKFTKQYGVDTALVIRDTSGVDWDWILALETIKQRVDFSKNPFDRGVWILNLSMTRLHRIDQEPSNDVYLV
jgi:hypothetical protein